MDIESKDKLREQARSTIKESRLANRDRIWSSKRKGLQDVIDIGRNISTQEVTILASKLKTKSLIQVEDLALLKIAFFQSPQNIVTFLKIKGALHGLVRELSSTRPNFELLAAECVCNLALGDAKSCLVVAKAAGPYLITVLGGFNTNLMAPSVWALGNLVDSDEKTWKVIHSQGFLGKLLKLISENDSLPDLRQELVHNSLIALSQLLRVGVKHLTEEELQSTLETVINLNKSSCKGLSISLFLLSCVEATEKRLMESKIHLKCLEFVAKEEITAETVTEYTACVRTIANLIAELSGCCALECFQNWSFVQGAMQKISSSTYTSLMLEFGWLLGNLVNHPSTKVQTEVAKFSEDLQYFESKLPLCLS